MTLLIPNSDASRDRLPSNCLLQLWLSWPSIIFNKIDDLMLGVFCDRCFFFFFVCFRLTLYYYTEIKILGIRGLWLSFILIFFFLSRKHSSSRSYMSDKNIIYLSSCQENTKIVIFRYINIFKSIRRKKKLSVKQKTSKKFYLYPKLK